MLGPAGIACPLLADALVVAVPEPAAVAALAGCCAGAWSAGAAAACARSGRAGGEKSTCTRMLHWGPSRPTRGVTCSIAVKHAATNTYPSGASNRQIWCLPALAAAGSGRQALVPTPDRLLCPPTLRKLPSGTPNSNSRLPSLLLLRMIRDELLLSSQAVAGNCRHSNRLSEHVAVHHQHPA